MTSISGTSLAAAGMQTPRARMDARLEQAVSAGTISKTDETALSSALDDIDTALSASRSAASGQTGTRIAPEEMKAKIDGLIDQEVKDGKLTDDQAAELKDLFGANGPERAQGPGGPPPPPATDEDDESTSIDNTTTTDTATSSADGTTKLDALISLLQKLRESMASNSDTYGVSTTTSQTALLVDKSA